MKYTVTIDGRNISIKVGDNDDRQLDITLPKELQMVIAGINDKGYPETVIPFVSIPNLIDLSKPRKN